MNEKVKWSRARQVRHRKEIINEVQNIALIIVVGTLI